MSSTELYLIAHKVRGEAAFDIAEPMGMVEGEIWWIIPTSGHRAYPYWTYRLNDLFAYTNVGEPPSDLRDHYKQITPTPAAAKRQSIDPYTDLMVARPEKTKPFTPTAEDL